MSMVTFVTTNCVEIHPGFGVTLNVYGSDMDTSRLVVFDSLGVRVGITLFTTSPIYAEVGMANGTPGFTNGNYSIGFVPYETETYPLTVTCPLVNLSGLYIINQTVTSRRDTYLTTNNKIPDPTIRTALLGE